MSKIGRIERLLERARENAVEAFVSQPHPKTQAALEQAVAAVATFGTGDMRRDDVIETLEEELDVAAAILRVAERLGYPIKGTAACKHGVSGCRCDDCYATFSNFKTDRR